LEERFAPKEELSFECSKHLHELPESFSMGKIFFGKIDLGREEQEDIESLVCMKDDLIEIRSIFDIY
jgi:hypothetical protein